MRRRQVVVGLVMVLTGLLGLGSAGPLASGAFTAKIDHSTNTVATGVGFH